MKRILLAFIVAVCASSVEAQKIYTEPATRSIAIGGTQTCSSVVSGVNNKAVTWATTGGTIVPGIVGANETQTVGLTTNTPGTYTLTATPVASGSFTGTFTCAITFVATPTPTTGHPRFLVTTANLAAMRAKGVIPTNTIYQGMVNRANADYSNISSNWTFSTYVGGANPCTGGSGPTTPDGSAALEAYAFLQIAMFDANSTTRDLWGCRARDLWNYYEANTQNGNINLAGNAWSDSADSIAVPIDWLASRWYSSAEIANSKAWFSWIEQQVLTNPFLSNGCVPNFTVAGNSSAQFDTGSLFAFVGQRCLGNNYTLSRMLYLVAGGLTFDDNSTDDPPPSGVITATISAGGSGYNVGDDFTIVQGSNTTGSGQVTGVSGGVTSITIFGAGGQNYTTGAATTTHISPSVGTGLTLNITVVGNTCSATRYQVCADGTAGSLHAYWNLFDKTMLYTFWAHIEDPNISWAAYQTAYANLPTVPSCNSTAGTGGKVPCFGDGRGGEATEGTNYSYSLFRILYAFDMIHTAGYDDPIAWGPQISAITSSYWDLYATNQLDLLTGPFTVSGTPIWNYLTTGDSTTQLLFTYSWYGDSMLMAFNSYTGRTDNTAMLEWPLLNVLPGGISNWNSTAWSNNGNGSSVLLGMFIALPSGDPTVSPPSDPRPGTPTDIYVGGNKHVYVRSGFASTDSLVTTYSVDGEIDHEHSFSGKYEVFQNNEYITKGRTEFDNYDNTWTQTPWSNLVSIQNSAPTSPSACSYFSAAQALGGQWFLAEQADFTAPVHSELPAYSAFIVDQLAQTNASNVADCAGVNDATVARRSTVYIRGTNQIASYDRAATGSARDKALFYNTTGTPSRTGNTFSWPTPSATQKAYLTILSPPSPTYTATPLSWMNDPYLPGGTAWIASHAYSVGTVVLAFHPITGAPTIQTVTTAGTSGTSIPLWANSGTTNDGSVVWTFQFAALCAGGYCDYDIGGVVEADAGTITGPVQFLHVLEWGPSSLTKTSTTLVNSSAGQNFDGSLIGTNMVMFMRSPTTFTGTTYAASGATTHYIADLVPGSTYTITGTGTPGSVTADTAGVITFSATGTGNITVGSGSPPPTNLSGFISGAAAIGGNSVHR